MRAWLTAAGICWVALVVLVGSATAVAPVRHGPLALAEIGLPFLLLSTLLFVPLAALRQRPGAAWPRRLTSALRLALVAAAALAIVRLGPVWVSGPPSGLPEERLQLLSWNVESGQVDPAELLQQVAQAPRGVIVLVELSKADGTRLSGDAAVTARFPNQLLYPRDGSLGMGLLSSYPVLESGRRPESPAIIWARLDLGAGRSAVVIGAHPVPGDIRTFGSLQIPLDYDATTRDADIRTLRSSVDTFLARGEPLLLAGDFNVTDREPAYADLAAGLLDAHLEVGLGPGSTWRPDPVKWLPLGLMRIDMVFAGNGARPVSMTADCTPRGSDHCLVRATLALP